MSENVIKKRKQKIRYPDSLNEQRQQYGKKTFTHFGSVSFLLPVTLNK